MSAAVVRLPLQQLLSRAAAAAAAAAAAPEAAAAAAGGGGTRQLLLAQGQGADAAAGDREHAEMDRFYFPFAVIIYTLYSLKLAPHLSWCESLQNAALVAMVAAMAALCWWKPALCHRHSRLLRPLLLALAYSLPVFTSMDAMQAFSPAPSTVPYLNWLVDSYSLWLSTRSAFLVWALVGCRPPLHLAVPLQLLGLWRASSAGFCHSAILAHPVMQDRTSLAHALFSMTSMLSLGPHNMRTLILDSPEKRCKALLLFYNTWLAFLLPLLWLALMRRPKARQHRGALRAGGRQLTAGALAARLEEGLDGLLRQLMWQSPSDAAAELAAAEQQQPDSGASGSGTGTGIGDSSSSSVAWQEAAAACPPSVSPFLLRWWLVLTILWAACCLLEG